LKTKTDEKQYYVYGVEANEEENETIQMLAYSLSCFSS
jgi:hypothetical protein